MIFNAIASKYFVLAQGSRKPQITVKLLCDVVCYKFIPA